MNLEADDNIYISGYLEKDKFVSTREGMLE